MSGVSGLSASALATLQRAFAEAPEVAVQELEAAAYEATMLLEAEVKDVWPTGVFNSKQQITSDVSTTPTGVLGVVGTPSPYAPVIEDGRRPGKGVSKEGRKSLEMWAVGILGVSPDEAERVAFLVSRKIKERGIEAKQPFAKTLAANEAQILRMFEDACGRIAAHLAGDAA